MLGSRSPESAPTEGETFPAITSRPRSPHARRAKRAPEWRLSLGGLGHQGKYRHGPITYFLRGMRNRQSKSSLYFSADACKMPGTIGGSDERDVATGNNRFLRRQEARRSTPNDTFLPPRYRPRRNRRGHRMPEIGLVDHRAALPDLRAGFCGVRGRWRRGDCGL